MEVFAYCPIPNHVHLIFRSSNEDPSGLIRDFKGFTARRLIKTIEKTRKKTENSSYYR
jgi:putative transposase